MTPIKSWRAPNDEQIAAGQTELAKIIGPVEAAKLSWQRRLVVSEPDGAWCLTVEAGGKPSWDTAAPYADPPQLVVTTLAYPLAEAVAILQGLNNSEEILRQRREACKVHEAEENRAKAEAQAETNRREADSRQLDADKERFNFDGWAKLEPWQQGFYGLAVLVRDRDPDLAANLRTIASEGRGFKPARPGFPRCDWERGS